MQWSGNLENGNIPWGKLKQVFQKYPEYQVIMVRITLGMRHLSTSQYGPKAGRNAALANSNVL